MANIKRINIAEILENVIEVDEPTGNLTTTKLEYESLYLKGAEAFEGSNELFNFLEVKAT